GDPVISKDDEKQMTFLGLIVLSDPLKPDIGRTVEKLKNAGIMLKLITGDNQLVAKYVGSQIGLRSENILTGGNLSKMANEALVIQAKETDIFAETEPHQKERIVSALQKAGNVVGYIGDGINDATALKTADVGISVDTAVDIAKETADIIFLERDLGVLHDGIMEGRRTFVNTMKYIFITTSANFGNMFSVAGASLILPFLPLLPKQILLLNLLTDLPAMAITSDSVDQEATYRPLKWNATLIRNFMIVFGIESSVFDFATFGILLYYFQADMSSFQTGWFLESAITEIMILMIIRTQRPVLKSKPGKYLILATLLVGVLTITIPYLPHADLLGFSALPWTIIAGMCGVTVLYAIIAETTKRLFFNKIKF
ncbi:MAG: HAD-IC family P-type ATPase, partial [Chryseosolibacter sp.]